MLSIPNQKPTLCCGADLQLRLLTPDAITASYVNWMNDYEVVKYTEQRFVKHDTTSVTNFVNQTNASVFDHLFGIFFHNMHIGNIKVGPINQIHSRAYVSYLIGVRSAWGNGIGTRSVKTIVDYSFDHLQLQKLQAGYYSLNVGSGRVLEKCGFKIEGQIASGVEFEGQRINAVLTGLTKAQHAEFKQFQQSALPEV